MSDSATTAKYNLASDPDIVAESVRYLGLADAGVVPSKEGDSAQIASAATTVPLCVRANAYVTTYGTSRLLHEVGGLEAIRKMTEIFYKRVFLDSHLKLFFSDTGGHHAVRLSAWIVEKMGGEGPVWTQERVERAKCPFAQTLSDGSRIVVSDRTSAHVAAWFSPLRKPADAGQHFKVHDCRVWMRLMFWSARDCGLFCSEKPAFEGWFPRFIGHFVRVYERAAPKFARESARWSLDQANIDCYLAAGRTMTDVIGPSGAGVSPQEYSKQVPRGELEDALWPYED